MGKEEEEVVVGVVGKAGWEGDGLEVGWGEWEMKTEYIIHMYGILKEYILSYMFLKKSLAYERFFSKTGQEERE